MKEKICLINVKYWWLSLNTSKGLVFCVDTHVYDFKSFWHKYGKINNTPVK